MRPPLSQAAPHRSRNAGGSVATSSAVPAPSRSYSRPAVAAAPAPEFDWRRAYVRRLLATDMLVIVWAIAGAHLLRTSMRSASPIVDPFGFDFLAASALVVGLWALFLAVLNSRDSRVVGFGSEEYKRVLNATFIVFALVSMSAYLFGLDMPRSYLLLVMPAGLLGLLLGRYVWRRWLHLQRDRGMYSANVLAVGNLETVSQLVSELRRSPRAGYRIVGACVTQGSKAADAARSAVQSNRFVEGVPVLGSLDQIVSAVRLVNADVVAVTATSAFGPAAVRKLSWDLEKLPTQLILAPALTDIAGPRIHTQPVAGLPLIHVERPTYSGPTRILKKAFDVVGSMTLLLIFSPLMLGLAMAIKTGSPGPVFFRQERVGVDGGRFRMVKFRSMRVDAEALLADLKAEQRDAGNDVLFKMKDDPRITKVGKLIRRYSLDELPQLLNVLKGEMSLVGPRPPLHPKWRCTAMMFAVDSS
ncbi:exopolysaccharide biosynthesis polyprenyl glycosylphosphotransferase [Nakamurella antarctica]|uniref:exopolysaccharide biosynthesis polyprenyl glycosylphosphotransferase n=1 Tax=Nakamurella antarctica TaxID=1902245 RepID=UPI0019D2DDA3